MNRKLEEFVTQNTEDETSANISDAASSNKPETAAFAEPANPSKEIYLQTALYAGQIALANGAETARCDDIMQHILSQSEEKEYVTSIVSTSLFARLGKLSSLVTIKKWNVNLNRVHLANEVSRNLCDKKISIFEAKEQLEQIEKASVYKFIHRLIAYALLGAFLPIFLSGTIYDCLIGIFCGIIMACADTFFRHINIRSFIVVMLETILMVLCACIAAQISKGLVDINIVVAAAINPLLPGLALTNSVRDTLQGDYVSGGGRLVEALIRSLSLALGVFFGLSIGSLFPASINHAAITSPEPLVYTEYQIILLILAAVITAGGYCIVMEVPPKFLLPAMFTGAFGKFLYMFCDGMQMPTTVSTFFSTLVITILSQLFARRAKAPTILFLISGIMSLVPGSTLYASVFDLIQEDYMQGMTALTQTLMTGVAIAVAIFLVDTLFNVITLAKKKELIEK